MKYNLDVLSPLEFEKLSRDIISKKLDMEFKVFKPGRDSGIDLRNKDKDIICQCKHIQKFSDLKSNLKKEVEKLSSIKNLKKYYLIVSTKLTPANEDSIIEIFDKYITSSDQIISYNEIEQFLDDDENIEILKKNSKLWLTSYKIIELFEQKYINFEITNLLSHITTNMSYFVETGIFKECYEKLNSDRLLIISGSPRVGKTINSNMLVAKMIADNPKLKLKTIVGSNYRELIQSFNKDDFEIIILDDFLGQSYLEKSNDEINEIISIIEYAKNNSKKYLILNSRLNVLSDVRIKNEKFSRILDLLDGNNYMIDMDNITLLEKAEILFNLHYFNKVPEKFYEELKKDYFWRPRYEAIVTNTNYNTRIIEYCVLNYKKDNITYDKYFDYIMDNLNNPRQVWHKQFLQLTNEEISYLYSMYSINTSNVSSIVLKECYENVIKKRSFDSEKNSFNNVTERLSDNIITQKIIDQNYVMNTINPSVNDYIMNNLMDNLVELEKMADECIYIEQFINLVNINTSLLQNTNIDILKLKSYNNEFDNKLLYLIEKYNWCNNSVKDYFVNILNHHNSSQNSIILRILSSRKLVDFYELKDYVLNVNYIKELLNDSDNYYIKNFIEYLDELVSDSNEDMTELLKSIYSEFTPIIESKIEDNIYEDICTDIDDIVHSKEKQFKYKIVDDEYVVENMSEMQDIIDDELNRVIESKIDDEKSNYLLYKIEFENLSVNIKNCYDYSYIEQSILDDIQSLNNKSCTSDEFRESYSIHDVFSQSYKLED